jgi:TPR repeat protein
MRYFGLVLALLLSQVAPGFAQTSDPSPLMERATAGDVEAQLELALAYHSGTSVAQNYAQAARWAQMAAIQGNAQAQNLLGRYAHGGLGVKQDQATAIQLLRAAAQQGDSQHIFDLGNALEQGADGSSDLEAAAQAYKVASDQGHLDATVSLGVMAQNGSGVPQDFGRARTLYEIAAKAGHARAQNNLGLLYVRGDGVAQDYGRAVALFTAAAEQNLKPALRNLSVMYESGFGIPLDEAHAAELGRLAAQVDRPDPNWAGGLIYDTRLLPPSNDLEQLARWAANGDPVAQFQLGWTLQNNPAASQIDAAQAARLFGAAARKGHAPSMVNLGFLYFEGQGVAQDYMLGQMWLTLAAQSGLPASRAALAHYAGLATPAQVNQAQQMAQELAAQP